VVTVVIYLYKKGLIMGNERDGMTRITFFVPDNLAIQLKENSYLERKTLTHYLISVLLKEIKRERTREQYE